MLLVVSPNLCLDRIVVVRDFDVGRVHRAESATELEERAFAACTTSSEWLGDFSRHSCAESAGCG